MKSRLQTNIFIHNKLVSHRRQIGGFGLILLGLCALGLMFHNSPSEALLPSGEQTDLIAGQDWSHFSGATPTSNGIQIQALGRAIVNQDGSDNQTDPPVNVRGPHLSFDGNIKLGLKASQVPAGGTASFYLYGRVPIIYDEWRYQPPQLRLDLNQQKVTVYEWTGRSDSPAFTKSWPLPVGGSAYIEITTGKKNKNLTLRVNGQSLGSISGNKLFNGGNIWFGADNQLGNPDWTIRSLSVEQVSGKMKVVPAAGLASPNNDSQTLRSLSTAAPRHLPIAAAIASYPLYSDSAYRQLAASQINMLVPENELKAQFTEPQPNVYSFTEADNLVDFALANGMTVHGHNLVFSEANPQWMQTAPPSQRQQIMVNHITAEVSHFGGKINEWDVVDEPLNDNNDNNADGSDLRQNIWYQAMGENYIDTAFKAARAANPGAKLYLNEYGLEASGSRWDEFLSLVKRLQARGVPIDGVGFQAHVYEPGDEVDTATIEKHMNILAGLGLASRISEMDVYGDDAQHQADQFSAALKACLDVKTCTSFTMWGLTDRYGSTTDYHAYPLSYGNDLVWDENMQPKSAYQSLQNTLNVH